MAIIRKTEDRRMVKDVPDTEVTGPNLATLKTRIDTVDALGFDIIVGTQAEIDLGKATHLVATFVAAIQDNSRVLIRRGTHAVVQNEDITESGVVMVKEDRTAILAMSSFTFTVSGDENELNLRFDSLGLDSFIVSGDNNEMVLWSANGNSDPFDDAGADNSTSLHVI